MGTLHGKRSKTSAFYVLETIGLKHILCNVKDRMAIIKGHAEASYLHCVSLRFVANFVSGQAATGRCYPPSSDIQMAWLARGAEVRPNLAH